MKVQSVSYVNGLSRVNNSESVKKYSKIKNFGSDSFEKISFTGYEKALDNAVSTFLKKDKDVEKVFGEIINNLHSDDKILKNEFFCNIWNIYNQKGFKGLMLELWKPRPQKKIQDILNFAELGNGYLAISTYPSKKPAMELYDFGKHGFWNSIFNNSKASRDVKLSFSNEDGNKIFDVGLTKNGCLNLTQKNNEDLFLSEFYPSGNIRRQTVNYPVYPPETTYYKENGSEDGLKNWLLGGSPIFVY